MTDTRSDDLGFERFRDYLRLLAQISLAAQLRSKVDPSDLVQETLLKAHQHREKLEGRSEGEIAAWLRKALSRHLLNEVRWFRQPRRDLRRECRLEELIEDSSVRVNGWAARNGSSPGGDIEQGELVSQMVRALDSIEPDARQALVLQYWHGWTLQAIGQHMERSTTTVVRLLRKALSALREKLPSLE